MKKALPLLLLITVMPEFDFYEFFILISRLAKLQLLLALDVAIVAARISVIEETMANQIESAAI